MSEVFGTLEICVVLEGFIDREVTVNFFYSGWNGHRYI